MRETRVWSLGWEDPLEKGKAPCSSILAWRIPWTVESVGSHELDTPEWLSLPESYWGGPLPAPSGVLLPWPHILPLLPLHHSFHFIVFRWPLCAISRNVGMAKLGPSPLSWVYILAQSGFLSPVALDTIKHIDDSITPKHLLVCQTLHAVSLGYSFTSAMGMQIVRSPIATLGWTPLCTCPLSCSVTLSGMGDPGIGLLDHVVCVYIM